MFVPPFAWLPSVFVHVDEFLCKTMKAGSELLLWQGWIASALAFLLGPLLLWRGTGSRAQCSSSGAWAHLLIRIQELKDMLPWGTSGWFTRTQAVLSHFHVLLFYSSLLLALLYLWYVSFVAWTSRSWGSLCRWMVTTPGCLFHGNIDVPKRKNEPEVKRIHVENQPVGSIDFLFWRLTTWPCHPSHYVGEAGVSRVKGVDPTSYVCDFREAFNLSFFISKMI